MWQQRPRKVLAEMRFRYFLNDYVYEIMKNRFKFEQLLSLFHFRRKEKMIQWVL